MDRHEAFVQSYLATRADLAAVKKANQDIIEKWSFGLSAAGLGFLVQLTKDPQSHEQVPYLISGLIFFVASMICSVLSALFGIGMTNKEEAHLETQMRRYACGDLDDPFNNEPPIQRLRLGMRILNWLTGSAVIAGMLCLAIFSIIKILR